MSKSKSVIIDPKRWMFEDFSNYVKDATAGKFESAFRVLHKAIVSWDYDVDLKQEHPDRQLKFTDLPDIIYAVGKILDNFYEELDIVNDLLVDMTGWAMEDYYAYQDAVETGNLSEIEAYMKMVAIPTYPEYDPSKRLSLYDGLLMRKGIEKAQQNLFRKR